MHSSTAEKAAKVAVDVRNLYDDRNTAESYVDEKRWDEAERDLR